MNTHVERKRINGITCCHFPKPNHFAKKNGFFPLSRGASPDFAGEGVCFAGGFGLADMRKMVLVRNNLYC